jgi:mitochondrial fission protein ELM1
MDEKKRDWDKEIIEILDTLNRASKLEMGGRPIWTIMLSEDEATKIKQFVKDLDRERQLIIDRAYEKVMKMVMIKEAPDPMPKEVEENIKNILDKMSLEYVDSLPF